MPWTLRSEFARGYRAEHTREVFFPLLPRAEAQKAVKALRSAGKARPIMPGGVERLDDNPAGGVTVPVTLHWRSGSGMREPHSGPRLSAAADCQAPPAACAGRASKAPGPDARAEPVPSPRAAEAQTNVVSLTSVSSVACAIRSLSLGFTRISMWSVAFSSARVLASVKLNMMQSSGCPDDVGSIEIRVNRHPPAG